MSIYDYSGCIKLLFDRPIIEDPEVITGTEPLPLKTLLTDAMLSVSSNYSGRLKAHAIDGDIVNTRWQTNTSAIPGWFAVDLGASKIIGMIRLYTVSGQYPITAYTIQASDNNSIWSDIYTGTISSSFTGWTDVTFTPQPHQYWRVYITAGVSNWATLYEFKIFESRIKYRTDGWEVSAMEPDMSPGGNASKKIYTVRKITKSEDGLSVFVWLDLYGRIKYPQGDITVKFNGTLVGLGNSNVEPFEVTFPPTMPAKIFNPNGIENLTANTRATLTCFDVAYRYAQKGAENITAQASATVVVTKVGSLPL